MREWPARAAICFLLAGCSTGPLAEAPAATGTAQPGGPVAASPAPTPVPAIGRGPERLDALPRTRPTPPELSARLLPVLVEDHCVDRDLFAPATDEAALTILDRSYALAASYAPDDLVPAGEAGFGGVSGTKLVRAVMLDDLAAMRDAWEAQGLTIVIDSAYRSHTDQAATFDSWVARIGPEQALLRTARPGHSEHQLGTAIDVSSPGWAGRFGDWALESAEGAWMAAHAWEYGFVMSYPAGGQERTCFGYEPWHYRWIGREAAAEHRASGEFLRDFLAGRGG